MQKKKSNKVWSDLYELFLIYSFIKRFILAASVLRTLHVYLHSNLHTCYFFWTGSAHVCPVRKCDAFVSGEGGVDLCFSGVWKHDWACGPPTGGAGRSRPTLCADTAAGFLHRVMITCDVVFPRSELFWFGVKFWLFTIRGNEPRTFMSFSFCFCDLLVFILSFSAPQVHLKAEPQVCPVHLTHHWVQEWIQHAEDEDDLTTVSVSQYFTDRPLPLMSVLT